MPHYNWKGPGELQRRDQEFSEKPQMTEPPGPSPEGGPEMGFLCEVEDCGRKFKIAALMARHFNASHEDLREDEDSWREWAREVEL